MLAEGADDDAEGGDYSLVTDFGRYAEVVPEDFGVGRGLGL